MLLQSLIFHYHGLDGEKELLEHSAKKLSATSALDSANDFIVKDYLSAFERSEDFFMKIIGRIDPKSQLDLLIKGWGDNHKKGYVTEMETTAMINLSKDWGIDKEFLKEINH